MVFEGFKRWKNKAFSREDGTDANESSKASASPRMSAMKDSGKVPKIFKRKDSVQTQSSSASPGLVTINASASTRTPPTSNVPLYHAQSLGTPKPSVDSGKSATLHSPQDTGTTSNSRPANNVSNGQSGIKSPGLAKGVPSMGNMLKPTTSTVPSLSPSPPFPGKLPSPGSQSSTLEKAKSQPAAQFQAILKQNNTESPLRHAVSSIPGSASSSSQQGTSLLRTGIAQKGPGERTQKATQPKLVPSPVTSNTPTNTTKAAQPSDGAQISNSKQTSPASGQNQSGSGQPTSLLHQGSGAPEQTTLPSVLKKNGQGIDQQVPTQVSEKERSNRATNDDQTQIKKRVAIAAETNQDTKINIPITPKNSATMALLEKATESNLLFETLPKAARKAIFTSMSPTSVSAGNEIIRQGDEGTNFYILERGLCQVFVKKPEWGDEPKHVHTYNPGSGFGELALLYSALRAATVKATTDCRLWVMDRAVYNAIKYNFTVQQAAEKRALIASVPMLSVLSMENREVVADALELEEFEPGDFIFREGDLGDRFYIIKDGTVILSKGPEGSLQVIEKRGVKAYFGERALIKAESRTVDASAETVVSCYTLKRTAFVKLLGPIEEIWKLEALRKVPILFNLPETQLKELAVRMKTQSIAKDEIVFNEGETGDTFYVIEDGTFLIYNDAGQELARVSKGSCFGELALLNQAPRAASVRALTSGHLLTLTRKNFNELLGSLADIRQMWRFEALGMVPILGNLTPGQRSALCSAMKAVRIETERAILTAGKPSSFYVIEAGNCSVCNETGQEVAILGPTMYMGEAALGGIDSSKFTVRASSTVDLLMLQRSDAVRVLGPEFLQLVGQQKNVSQKQTLKMSDLVVVARLGAGAFGLVSLVKEGTNYYALKQMGKGQIVQMGLQEHVKREKLVMAECDCPFMVNLVAAFKDNTNLYMLQEAIMGGELFTYLQSRQRPLSEDHAKFYAASVVLGLEYMQQRNIMWRDLKPENLLIDTRGYLKMADFGFAKKMPVGQKSYTLCGTPEYLAPELVTQSGHNRAVDWWATGVLIYEMVAGTPPFYDEDRVTMFKNICHVRFNMPAYFSKELKDLVKKILVLNPAQRLGALKGGAADVKAHPWFHNFDWQAFADKTLIAPHVPKVRHPEDASNFVPPPADAGSDQGVRYTSTGIFKDF